MPVACRNISSGGPSGPKAMPEVSPLAKRSVNRRMSPLLPDRTTRDRQERPRIRSDFGRSQILVSTPCSVDSDIVNQLFIRDAYNAELNRCTRRGETRRAQSPV